MSETNLSKNEMNILYHLVAYPDYPDKIISSKVGLGISTVTKIRNRLLDENYLMAVNIPSVQQIDGEILSLGYGEFNPYISLEHKLEKGKEWMNQSSGSFFSFGDGNQALGMGFYRDFTAAMETILMTKQLLCRQPMMTTGDLNSILISFKIARIFRFFNYAPMLAKFFAIEDHDYQEPDRYFTEDKKANLSKKERLVLYGLVKYPSYSDKKLSTVLGISRQTISSVRKRFKRDSIITRRYIPNIGKLGFEVIVFAHVQLTNDAIVDPTALQKGLKDDNIFLSLCHGTDVVTLSAFSSFSDTKARISNFLKDTKERAFFSREPIFYLFSATDVVYQVNHFYEIPIATILGIDPNTLRFLH